MYLTSKKEEINSQILGCIYIYPLWLDFYAHPFFFLNEKLLAPCLFYFWNINLKKVFFFQLSESIRLDKLLNCYLAIILSLVHGKNHLRRHPVRRPNKTVGRTRDTGRAEVGQLDVTRICYQNIASFYVPKVNIFRVGIKLLNGFIYFMIVLNKT